MTSATRFSLRPPPPRSGSALDGVPLGLGPVRRAVQVGRRAAAVGFDWGAASEVAPKVIEELSEVLEAFASGSATRTRDELGDLLLSVISLARHLDVDPCEALDSANRTFERRFRAMEAQIQTDGRSLPALTAEELDASWRAVKAEEAG